jgi:hypothetical protein
VNQLVAASQSSPRRRCRITRPTSTMAGPPYWLVMNSGRIFGKGAGEVCHEHDRKHGELYRFPPVPA